jgi:PAB-dependent poly(A)-specific ribonuclease subunit 2
MLSLQIILDDYVLQSEPVVDHLTRFSGITPQDLDPFTSRHSLVPLRVAYLKLRCLVDRGCILLGHGLAKVTRLFRRLSTANQWLFLSFFYSFERTKC